MTVAFKTFGCRLNRAEALDEEARYYATGYTIVGLDETAPDIIVVRGCSVTAKAQRDCEKEIERLRSRYPRAEIRLVGCLPEAIRQPDHQTIKQSGSTPLLPMGTSRAYLKVQDGCSGKCAFCIVPQFRGSPTSVPFSDVLARARTFLSAGYRELVVTGCNLALYRSEGNGLADLLSALAQSLTGGALNQSDTLHRIRLGSLEPGICDDAILDAFERHPNICRFIHLSLQSGSDAVLKRMNRPYTAATVARFCSEAFRRLGIRLSLGADVIAGFPDETEEDHLLTRRFLSGDFLKHSGPASPHGFTNLHVFPFSERPGTPAATMNGALPRSVRLDRARELENLGRAQRAKFARSFIGQTVEVCVEKDCLHGWTGEYLHCKLKGPAQRRSLVKVVIDRVEDDVLFAR